MMSRTTMALAAIAGVLLASSLISRAGPLNPPPGAVSGTYKTLAEVEPRTAVNAINTPGDSLRTFRISKPGSYYLTGNVVGEPNKFGIEIASSDVTLDLGGFEVAAPAGAGQYLGVCTLIPNLTNVAVINGSVRGWATGGLSLSATVVSGCRVENVLASGNGIGIEVGNHGMVRNCSATGNASIGILGTGSCTISGCAAGNNGAQGMFVYPGSTLSECVAYGNGGIGIAASEGCTIIHCSADVNTGAGIQGNSHSTVIGCTSYSNTGGGIVGGYGSHAEQCEVAFNQGAGITVYAGSTVTDCNAHFNTLDGIMGTEACVVRGNTCSGNGYAEGDGAGIHLLGSNNRIEGNHTTYSDRGIDVDSPGNIILRNTCSGNTNNWDVVAGNVILVVNATVAGAVSGNAGGTGSGSVDPNANFTY